MTAERWTQAVRWQVGLGRLLPLGGPHDGAWITEEATGAVLGHAAAVEAPNAQLGALRIAHADPEDVGEPVVPAPPGALSPGELRVTADFAATAAEPLPAVASRLRLTLASAATQRLGLAVTEVDLRVTDLLETGGRKAGAVRGPRPAPAREAAGPDEARVAAAALSVPGVTGLRGSFGGTGRAVQFSEYTGQAELPHRHVRVELAVSADHRALDVARRVRAAVREALEDRPTVAVLVTVVG
ncbi:nucleopolyhedrovirus P10 family protein [Streptomyces pluripotens]|uniref:Nucleopolyhedrovirus P10 family protein n=1 Tax=Streptomyces pluripotens TaxID=1355015 RepID=A0A221NWD5_9ACTN|nr:MULTISPECIES: hypothetical protein [Streptomyces]ARP69597.1 nucleopolyhedrovirus P10 family protein [Streptomyces pluripotens]ASN23855.1 nucleopolyhedrovirus P10 family protein [Streptomyces pluripotens]KIE24523.1 nucleopolyhedrovirus P10 family protein [Streptomyces sp. MUSC 125]